MGMSEVVINKSLKVLEPKTVHSAAYIVDEQGKEVQITTAMIRTVCQQLLKQCRTIKS
ncbi:PA1571 family protein [Acinetobacter indicus]|jgi:hypothetical protein|uniref:Uncharacterized protein n=4 Tax=Acinetobacter indicus TaxID=756892 RepID=V2U458_9GAMM|nr:MULTISPECIES: PA1571 family protein [Acinetobacter]EPF72399.1 hypothetical protein F956_01849 [Acinetobacter indicus ANC 4215]ESK48868.1 hypothetical protein P253_01528 [Acinetobacter indicus CIP 110367]ENW89232.1 hypothetical protein F905_01704 [Acinetobacter sp. CIP 53.82]MBA0155703.1 hypothetical protein [Acinetobacter indicus]MCO8089334.1 hypothetical protein [Acinetobacter indicus]